MTFLSPPRSARAYLLIWIITPIAIFIAIDTFTLYRSALDSVNTAYDRMLIASAHSIGDLLRIENDRLEVSLPHAALEIYEADDSSRMIYRINGLHGEFLSGDRKLPEYTGPAQSHESYPAVVHIYEDKYEGESVRVAALFQPVASNDAKGSALIQVAETTENRKRLTRKIFWETLIRLAALLALVSLVTICVVSHALRPLHTLKKQLDQRRDDDLSPVSVPSALREIQPVVSALNQLMARLQRLLDHQQRFVADASHQLRTPLAILKTQLQSGLRGDAPPITVLKEMASTVDRATNLANQLLSLAKVEQLRGRGTQELCDLVMLAREAVVDLSPLIGDKNLDFEMEVEAGGAPGGEGIKIMGHPWMLSELISNLLHNAIRHTPNDSKLGIRITNRNDAIWLCVWDTGPGLADELQKRVFQPFASSYASKGGGLGLTICSEIADTMHAKIVLENRVENGSVVGLNALVAFTINVKDEG